MFIREEELSELRKKLPEGTRVMLDSMPNEPATDMVPGITGTVRCVDDAGGIHVRWDNGHSLALLYDVDTYHVIKED